MHTRKERFPMPPLQTQKINPRTKRLEEMAQRFVSPGDRKSTRLNSSHDN